MLRTGSENEKLDALMKIHDFASSEARSDKFLLKNNGTLLIQVLHCTLKETFELSKDDRSMRFVQGFLNICHKLCSTKDLIHVNHLDLWKRMLIYYLLEHSQRKSKTIC